MRFTDMGHADKGFLEEVYSGPSVSRPVSAGPTYGARMIIMRDGKTAVGEYFNNQPRQIFLPHYNGVKICGHGIDDDSGQQRDDFG